MTLFAYRFSSSSFVDEHFGLRTSLTRILLPFLVDPL